MARRYRGPLALFRFRRRAAFADAFVFVSALQNINAGAQKRIRKRPLSPTLSYSFLGAGINILQGYGMTETCIVSANRPDDNRVGSIGKPFTGIEVVIADDGEMLVRGPNVMRGDRKSTRLNSSHLVI